MNPSTQEILSSFADLPTEKIIIVPNNKNILMAAQQTSALTAKEIAIVPSRSVPQGIAAMLAFQNDGDLKAVSSAMINAIDGIESGELAQATRSVEMNGIQVAEGQFIGLHNGDLAATGKNLEEALMNLLGKMNAGSRELITFYWGEDLDPSQANRLADIVRIDYPAQQVEIYEGGQPHYFLILSVE
jgi:dihydroxyacetone kinase-like predicted kinase